MTGLYDIGVDIVRSANARLDAVAANVVGVNGVGFKRDRAFQVFLESPVATASSGASAASLADAQAEVVAVEIVTDFSQGALRLTGVETHLALAGEGLFKLRDEAGNLFYTRDGQFMRDAEGRLVSAQGLIVQDSEGGDLIIGESAFEIAEDGVVLVDNSPTGRLGIYRAADQTVMQRQGATLFTAADEGMQSIDSTAVRQGAVEGSNVELGAEMIALMDAQRRMEAGAKVLQTFDAIIEQSISTFGKASR